MYIIQITNILISRLFLTDLSGSFVIDSWDIHTHNPEGIAVNNDKNEMYIVTDPSSPHGVQYVSAFIVIDIPEMGSGYASYNPTSSSSSTSNLYSMSTPGDLSVFIFFSCIIIVFVFSTLCFAFLWFREFLLFKQYRSLKQLEDPETSLPSFSLSKYIKSLFTTSLYSPIHQNNDTSVISEVEKEINLPEKILV